MGIDPSQGDEERERARLARRERDVPVPEADTPEALVATLADWGAEHRPHEPCPACGCTLFVDSPRSRHVCLVVVHMHIKIVQLRIYN